MDGNHIFLTYNIIKEDNIHKGIQLDHKGLSHFEIQQAINMYTSSYGDMQRNVNRLENLTSELLNENQVLKRFRNNYLDKYSSGD